MTTTSRTDATAPTTLVGNALLVYAMLGVAAWAAWPIYQSVSFVILVVASAALGTVIALVGARRRLQWLTVVAISVGTFLVVGVPLAVPSAIGSVATLLPGWVSLARGSVFSWKELATITTIPVGSYQALLVPALMLFLFGTVAMLSIAWRSQRFYAFVVPIALVIQLFGLVFGARAVSPAIDLGPFSITAPRELVVGLAAFFAALAFLLWRVQHARRVAVRAAQSLAGIRQGREATGSHIRRIALATAIVLIGVSVAVGLSPMLGSANERQVLRTAIDPESRDRIAQSPLSDYRSYFESDSYTESLFSVSGDRPAGSRLRLAVLPFYDGQSYRAFDESTDGTAESAFVRVPYTLDPGVSGTEVTQQITLDGYDGVWLPTAPNLRQVTFRGTTAQANSESFFYNAASASGVDFSESMAGATYELTSVVPETVPTLADIQKPSSPTGLVDKSAIPDSLTTWIKLQDATTDGQGLATLIDSLRARGYLSHSLSESPPAWADVLPGYLPVPSRAGHSTDRIDTLFTQLVDKQNLNGASLVAAIGDDEQFAVAGSLIAQSLGFPARVVLGFRLDTPADDRYYIAPCTDVCTGGNLTAWVEVQGDDGTWVTVDTTPQYTEPVNTIEQQQQDPENRTVVLPDAATAQDPPAAEPSGGDSSEQQQQQEQTDYTWLVNILKIVGLSLLAVVVLLAPFATVLFAKARRRNERRRAANPELQIVGGWDEYIDAALDHGYPHPTSETRQEVAAEFRTPRGLLLAGMADRAVFGPFDPESSESVQFWSILESERLAFGRGMSRWQRLRSALSLRSFTHHLRSRPGSTKR